MCTLICEVRHSRPIRDGKCLLTFVDDLSRKVWVYIINSKVETFAHFHQWKAMVETHIERKVQYLRLDDGTKFCPREFKKYGEEAGIIRYHT